MLDLQDRIYGCFLGKSIGGTLGMPYEGQCKFLTLDYYNPVPTEPVPNDDLDLQLVWLSVVREHGLDTDCQSLAKAWVRHIDAHPDEYGVAIRNIKNGMLPPETGWNENYFTRGMGAAIRSEIWAALFPGQPRTAAWYALQDACVDHTGEGIYSEVFLATLQSLLFGGASLNDALDQSLAFMPSSSTLRKGLEDVRRWYTQGQSYEYTRQEIMTCYGSHNFTDCIMNLLFILTGLLYGEGDFGNSLLLAVNCGQDTDCTGATVGACLGIMQGASAIPARWRDPVGDRIVVGDYILALRAPATVGALTEELLALQKRFCEQTLRAITPPLLLPEPTPSKRMIEWEVGETKAVSLGMPLRVAEIMPEICGHVSVQLRFCCTHDQEAQLMVCAEDTFRCYLNGKSIGDCDAAQPVLPAFHRVLGGRVFLVNLTGGQDYELRIELNHAENVQELWVGLSDRAHRHLLDARFLPVKASVSLPL